MEEMKNIQDCLKKKKSRGQETEIKTRLAKGDLLNQGDRYMEAPTGLPTYEFV